MCFGARADARDHAMAHGRSPSRPQRRHGRRLKAPLVGAPLKAALLGPWLPPPNPCGNGASGSWKPSLRRSMPRMRNGKRISVLSTPDQNMISSTATICR